MTVVGFTLSRILIERKEKIKEKVEVRSKIDLKDIIKEKIKLVESKDVLRFDFEFKIEYAPDLALIDFKGHILLLSDPKEADEIIKEWKKSKKLKSDIKLRVYNTIFHKCNIKAFELEEDFNLPLHLRLPMIKTEEKA